MKDDPGDGSLKDRPIRNDSATERLVMLPSQYWCVRRELRREESGIELFQKPLRPGMGTADDHDSMAKCEVGCVHLVVTPFVSESY